VTVTVRPRSADCGDATDDASIVDITHNNHVRERIQTVTSNDVPDRLASVASNAFGELVDGNRDTAVFTFEQVGMERICEKEEPAPLTTDAGSGVSCHPRGIRAPTISVGPR